MSELPKKPLVIFIHIILILSVFLIYYQVRNFAFQDYDDVHYVSENNHVLGGLTTANIVWAFTTGHASNWHPLTWLSLMLDCKFLGPNPGLIHLENMFLHLANTLLLFALLRKMTGSLWPSAFVAALFAVHPMHVESVAWVAERKDVLSTLFLLLTLAAYLSYVRNGGRLRYLLAILLFALGLLAKPMLVTLPFLLLLLDYWPLNRFGMPRQIKISRKSSQQMSLYLLIVEKIPFFILAAISSIITFMVQRSGGAVAGIKSLSLESRVGNAFLSYARYIAKMFWPQNLAVFYPSDIESFSFVQVLLCAVLLLIISVFAIYLGRNRKYLLVGWFWFVAALIPVIGLVQVGGQSFADRYTYVPYIGLFIMIAWGLPDLLARWSYRKIAFGVSMPVVLVILTICAHRQAGYWKNGFTLFSHAIQATKKNYVAYNYLGMAYREQGRYQEAIEAYDKSIQIYPNYDEAYNNLGVIYGEMGNYQDAIKAFAQALKISPNLARTYYNLGLAYANLGHYNEAIESFRQAVRIEPDNAEAYNNLGAVYGNLGRYREAIESFKQAVRIEPDNAEAHSNLNLLYEKLGRPEADQQNIKTK
jgi:Flp pilus assembly protein TadD